MVTPAPGTRWLVAALLLALVAPGCSPGERDGTARAAARDTASAPAMSHDSMSAVNHAAMANVGHDSMPGMRHDVRANMGHDAMPGMKHDVMPDMNQHAMPGMKHDVMPDMNQKASSEMSHDAMGGGKAAPRAAMAGMGDNALSTADTAATRKLTTLIAGLLQDPAVRSRVQRDTALGRLWRDDRVRRRIGAGVR